MIIYSYSIKKVYNEEILYLDISFEQEFAKLNSKNKKVKLNDIVSNFIKNNNIKFKGTTVALMAGSMMMGYIILNNETKANTINPLNYTTNIVESYTPKTANLIINKYNEEIKEEKTTETKEAINKNISKKINSTTSKNSVTTTKKEPIVEVKEEPIIEKREEKEESKNYITMKRSNGLITNIEIEEYVIGVVGAEMPASFNEEALKAQAVIARTYAVSTLKKGKILTDNSSTQNYKDNSELKKMWGSNYDKYYQKIKNAVNDTKGIYLTYNDKIIDAVYHSTSNGQTENAEYVWGAYKPYLVSVESEYDSSNKSFNYEKFIAYADLSKKINMDININTNFNIISKTAGDRVDKIQINDKKYTGVELRNLLGLRSADFKITKEENGISFKTKGYGHGVGLSQYGANGMAKAGYNYREILTHYYTGVKLTKI